MAVKTGQSKNRSIEATDVVSSTHAENIMDRVCKKRGNFKYNGTYFKNAAKN